MASFFGQDLKICPSAFSKYAGTTHHKGCFSLYQHHKSCISISVAPSRCTIYFLPCLLNLNSVLAGGKFSKLRMPFKQRQCTKWRKRSFFSTWPQPAWHATFWLRAAFSFCSLSGAHSLHPFTHLSSSPPLPLSLTLCKSISVRSLQPYLSFVMAQRH